MRLISLDVAELVRTIKKYNGKNISLNIDPGSAYTESIRVSYDWNGITYSSLEFLKVDKKKIQFKEIYP